ncbi:MAG: E3 binding domain-containing protein, partial [Pseudomonadota bacterium]|nr:E3 binding domain-containing protein [Pseudomonadota bacterium]
MGRYVFKLSDVGEGIAECEIATWRVKVGDVVAEDQPLVDMLTEKAAVELPSPVAGKIVELCGEAGDMVAVGGPLVILEVEGAGNAKAESAPAPKPAAAVAEKPKTEASKPAPAVEAASKPQTPAPAPPQRAVQSAAPAVTRKPGDKPIAPPAVRQRARELGIELQYVHGSGPAGRITHADLDAHVDGKGRA